MRRVLIWTLGGAASLVMAVVLTVAGLLGARTALQARDAAAIAIHSPEGIDWGGFVEIGGVREWVRIRGWRRSNPVLLILHGGPTDAQSPLSVLYAPLERDFTVVQWDQRGAGRTYGAGARRLPSTPYQRLVDDGVEVTAYLLRRLGQPKLILLGHSQGSALGLHMIKQRPDLYAAYVGTGQIASLDDARAEVYARVMQAARAAHDEPAIQRLLADPPPWPNLANWLPIDDLVRSRYADASDRAYWSWSTRPAEPAYVLTSPELNLHQLADWDRGVRSTIFVAPYPPAVHTDVRPLGVDYHVPIIIIQGRNDWTTPANLAKAWLAQIHAPHKEFILIDGGHWGAMTHMAKFRDLLVEYVRPFARARAAGGGRA